MSLVNRLKRSLRRECQSSAAATTVAVVPAVPGPGDAEGFVSYVTTYLHGWCSRQKALKLYQLVRSARPEVIVEIGVFGGRSLLPMCYALRENARGVAYGIDAWSPAASTEFATSEANDEWWRTVDYGMVKASFFRALVDAGLASFARVVETDSARAAPIFDCIDVLHIDGAHSAEAAAADVRNYVPKVQSGGYIIFDDVDWETTASAVKMVEEVADTVELIADRPDARANCAFFKKR